jgi:hypothetical protein
MKIGTGFRFLICLQLFHLCLLFADHAAAQTRESDIQDVVNRLFDGMRAGDSAMVRSAFLPGAFMGSFSVNSRDSLSIHHEDSIDGFLKAVGTPHQEKWNERVYNIKISVDEPMAVVWAPYKFYRGDTFSHCGVNVFTMVKTTSGWKIREVTDTRRKQNCQ